MVFLQNQLLRSCHEKRTHLKWRPNNTFGSTQKLCITFLETFSIQKASRKVLVTDSISHLCSPDLPSLIKARTIEGTTQIAPRNVDDHNAKKIVVHPYQAERIRRQNTDKRAFPLTSSSSRQGERWNGLAEGSSTGLPLIPAKTIKDMTEKMGNFHATLGTFRPWLIPYSYWSWINHKEQSSSRWHTATNC